MGAAVSNWQPPENDSIQLSKQDVIDIVGEENFDEEKFLEYSPAGQWYGCSINTPLHILIKLSG